jgi:hypothetical protein
MPYPSGPVAADVPNYDQLMGSLFGPGGKITFYLARVDEKTIALSYVTDELLLDSIQVLQGARPGLPADALLSETAAALPGGAQWVVYVSPKGTVDFARQLVGLFPSDAGASVEIPEFPATPPVGVAIQVAPGGLRSHTVIPGAAARAMGQYVVRHLLGRDKPEDAQ